MECAVNDCAWLAMVAMVAVVACVVAAWLVLAVVLLWRGHRRQYARYAEHRTLLMRQVTRENRATCTAWECDRRQRAAMPDVHINWSTP
jgi:negative regulator of sigma E activity